MAESGHRRWDMVKGERDRVIPIPDLPALVAAAALDDLPALAGRLAEAQAILELRLRQSEHPAPAQDQPQGPGRLLTPDEAIEVIGGNVSRKWLLRHTRGLRFRRDHSRKVVRFEETGLRRWAAAKGRV